jgi:hypothetical protein
MGYSILKSIIKESKSLKNKREIQNIEEKFMKQVKKNKKLNSKVQL